MKNGVRVLLGAVVRPVACSGASAQSLSYSSGQTVAPARGKTLKAYASLRLDYLVDDIVNASETGALGAGTSSPEVRANKPPVVKVDGPRTRTVKVGERLTLVAPVWVSPDIASDGRVSSWTRPSPSLARTCCAASPTMARCSAAATT